MNKLFIPILIFILLFAISVSATSNCYLNETFDNYVSFSDMLSGGQWIDGNGDPSSVMEIVEVSAGDKVLRINASTGSAGMVWRSIIEPFNASLFFMDCTVQDITMEWDTQINSLTGQISNPIQQWLIFSNESTISGGTGSISQWVGAWQTVGISLRHADLNSNWFIDLEIDPVRTQHWKIVATNNANPSLCTINYFKDGVFVWTTTSQTSYINKTFIGSGNNALINTEWYIDNIQVYDGSTTNWCGSSSQLSTWATLEVGNACSDSSQCISGLCEARQCALKMFAESCIGDYQCLSGECINDLCSKPSFWASIDASKTQQFGNDSSSNNFIALFLILGLPVVIIWAGRGHLASIMVSGLAFIGLTIFFAVVGWLSPFILLGIFLVFLLIIVFVFILRGGD